jgi:hypothetical protein
MRIFAVVLPALMPAAGCAAADISDLGASVLKLAEPYYYTAAGAVAIASPDFGRSETS